MAVEAIHKESIAAVHHFENKLAFEMGPFELNHALELKSPMQIIDLRMPEMYAEGHIPGSLNIDYEGLEKHLSKLSKDKPTVVYCYSIVCQLSAKAALLLAKKGYPVRELIGGWESWVKMKLPVDGKGQAQSCSTHKGSSPCA